MNDKLGDGKTSCERFTVFQEEIGKQSDISGQHHLFPLVWCHGAEHDPAALLGKDGAKRMQTKIDCFGLDVMADALELVCVRVFSRDKGVEAFSKPSHKAVSVDFKSWMGDMTNDQTNPTIFDTTFENHFWFLSRVTGGGHEVVVELCLPKREVCGLVMAVCF